MSQTTSTQIPAPVRSFYDRTLLDRALPYLTHDKFGQKRPIPLRSGDQPKFRRYNSLTAATAPITEGVKPNSQQLSKTDVTGQLYQYGSYVEGTDYIEYTSQDGDRILTETAEILGENAGESMDTVYRDALVAGSSIFYANSVASRAEIVTAVAALDLDKIIRALRTNKAKYFMEVEIPGKDGVGTLPIAPAFFAICHPYVTYDLKRVLTTSFIEPHKYADPSKAMPNEVGSYKNIRFIESTNAKIWPDTGGAASTTWKYTTSDAALDVYAILIFGKNAYGITDLAGKALENIVKPRGTVGSDPLDQIWTSAWKCTSAGAIILNDTFMYRYEVAVSV